MQEFPGYKSPNRIKFGTIIQSLFPSVKSTTTRDKDKTEGAYKNIQRKKVTYECEVVDVCKALGDCGFLIKKHENNFTQAFCSTGVTVNNVELYKELEIDNGAIRLKFAGKEINISEVMGIRKVDVTNAVDLVTALEAIKSLRPCTGFYLPKQDATYRTWGHTGKQVEGAKKTINCRTCWGLLPVNTLNTQTCKSCHRAMIYMRNKGKASMNQSQNDGKPSMDQSQNDALESSMTLLQNIESELKAIEAQHDTSGPVVCHTESGVSELNITPTQNDTSEANITQAENNASQLHRTHTESDAWPELDSGVHYDESGNYIEKNL